MVQKRGSRRYASKRNRNDHAATATATNVVVPPAAVAYYWNVFPTTATSEHDLSTPATTKATPGKSPPPPLTIDQFVDASLGSEVRPSSPSPASSLLFWWRTIQTSHGPQQQVYRHPTPVQRQAWSILTSSSASSSLQQHPDPPPPPQPKKPKRHHHNHMQKNTNNAILIAPTGSGKTYAYLLPMLIDAALHVVSPPVPTQKEMTTAQGTSQVEGIILVPTRELAQQVQTSVSLLLQTAHGKTLTIPPLVVALYGGGGGTSNHPSRDVQFQQLQMATIITATSGRLLDLLSTTTTTSTASSTSTGDTVKFPNLRTIVIDEADRMATHTDLSEQTKQILSLLMCTPLPSIRNQTSYDNDATTNDRRMILCSATWPDRATSTWKEWILQTATDASSTIVVMVDAMTMAPTSHRTPLDVPESVLDSAAIGSRPTTTEPNVDPVASPSSLITGLAASDVNHLATVDPSASKPPPSSAIVARIPSHLVQILHVCAEHKKTKKLLHTLDIIFNKNDTTQQKAGIIFFNKIKTIEHMHHFVTKERPHLKKYIMVLHSQLHQSVREQVWNQFVQPTPPTPKNPGRSMILLATDVAARGIHTPDIQFIINYDFPSNLEQYIHRCGRAGRNNTNENCDGGTNSAAGSTLTIPMTPPTIYSFFTRNLAPLANDLIQLLEASQQLVDPNLRALVTTKTPINNEKRLPKNTSVPPHPDTRHQNESDNAMDGNDDGHSFNDDDSDPFLQQLSPRRIALARASNVSDASFDADDESFND